jgi:hypothetical protein
MDYQPIGNKVKHLSIDPIFVIGSTRSGTTMLVRLIRKYFHINFGPETQFIVRYYNCLQAYGDLSIVSNFSRLAEDISRERFFKRAYRNFNYVFDIGKLKQSSVDKTYSALLSYIFSQFAEQQNMVRWGDKTPAYSHDLPVLNKLFPNAKYIHIIRDGRDVALSQFNIHFGPKNAFTAAKEWKNIGYKVNAFSEQIEDDRFIEFRYEDILTDPIPFFSQLIPFLSIDDSEGKVLATIKSNINIDLRKGNFYKWKKQFSDQQKEIFEREAGDVLKKYNYPVLFENPIPVSEMEKAFWKAHNIWKQLLRVDTWQDNIYRLSLRVKRLLRSI